MSTTLGDDPRWAMVHRSCEHIAHAKPRDPVWQQAVERAGDILYAKVSRDHPTLPARGGYQLAIDIQKFAWKVTYDEYRTLWKALLSKRASGRPNPGEAGPLPDEMPATDDVALRGLHGAELAEALGILTRRLEEAGDDPCDVVLLRDFAHLEFAEIAEILDITPENARQIHSRFHRRRR